jgi:DNA-binding NarL/FixJ family response regulator
MDDRIRVLVADDHALLRDALVELLHAQSDLEIVGEAGNTAETVARAAETKPHVILLDITMPGGSGIGILPELRRESPHSRVLVMTMHDEPSYLRAALAAGVAGYFVKSSAAAVLIEAIRRVHRSESFIDESMREFASEPAKADRLKIAPIARLSEREREVLFGLSQGLQYQAIAEQLGVSVKTVETYRARLNLKLGFKNRADMMRFAIESGILGHASH